MRKALFYIYALAAGFLLPVFIGSCVAETLVGLYKRHSAHWLAGAAVCLLTGAVVTWFPMLFLVGSPSQLSGTGKQQILVGTVLGWVGGILAPLVLGFRSLHATVSGLLIVTTLMTVEGVMKGRRGLGGE